MMTDKYKNFAELDANTVTDGVYRVEIEDRQSDFVVVAPHAGEIEIHTEKITLAIARDNYSYYAFIGASKSQHITSSNFDEVKCINLISKSTSVVTVHGKKDLDSFVMLGGLDKILIHKCKEMLNGNGFVTVEPADNVKGEEESNICNRGISKKGLQLEISRGLRNALAEDSDLLIKFSDSIRSVMI